MDLRVYIFQIHAVACKIQWVIFKKIRDFYEIFHEGSLFCLQRGQSDLFYVLFFSVGLAENA